MAYSVNNSIPVTEQFNKLISPSDTVDIVFTQPADLSGNGTYKILVYGFNNNDNYLANDTASLSIVNTGITTLENTENKFIIMPNPFAQYFRIIVESKTPDNVRLSIYNPAGKLLWEEEFAILPGDNILTVMPDTLPPGFYMLRFKGGTILKVARIVKSE
jgi:hypothetical protein